MLLDDSFLFWKCQFVFTYLFVDFLLWKWFIIYGLSFLIKKIFVFIICAFYLFIQIFSICLSFSVYMYICLSVCLSACLSIYLLYMYLSVFLYLSVCLSVRPSVRPSVCCCVYLSKSMGEIVWRRCEGIGSRGHVVGWLERRSLDTSASVRGQKEKIGVWAVDVVGWRSCVYVGENWLLIVLVFFCEESGEVISYYRSGGRWWRGTEEIIKCSEEITCFWSTVDLVVEIWWFSSVDFSRERWKQRLILTQVWRIFWFALFSLCCPEIGPMLTKNIG